jgi:hypothetical protein
VKIQRLGADRIAVKHVRANRAPDGIDFHQGESGALQNRVHLVGSDIRVIEPFCRVTPTLLKIYGYSRDMIAADGGER